MASDKLNESTQGFERDSALLTRNICPVCMVKVGTKRHALVQHFHRRKRSDLEHALYMGQYKSHFKHGRSKQPARKIEAKEVADMLKRHVGQQILSELLSMKTH
jgi:hypothetical protein